MYDALTPMDFPLTQVGSCVYRRSMSSPLFTAPSDELARDLAFRLNREEELRSSGHRWRGQALGDWGNSTDSIQKL